VDLGLTGRAALVCGGSRGIGRAIADGLAAEGVDVAIVARGREELEDAAHEIEKSHGVRALALPGDLTRPEDPARVVAIAYERFHRLDVLVTNTGGPPAGSFASHAHETWERAVQQNLYSVLHLVRAALPLMRERRWGRIINITSMVVKQPAAELILSNSIRAAVTGFARTLADEVARDGITVNNVMPGYTRTERLTHLAERVAQRKGIPRERALEAWNDEIPLGRLAEPMEIAALAVFLASVSASYITAQSIAADGGWIRSLL